MQLKRAILFSGALTAIIVGVFTLAYITAAATNKFSFSGRGIVTANQGATSILSINFSHMSADALPLALGKTVDVQVNQATLLTPDAGGRLKKIRQGNIPVGTEISVIGKVRTDDRFVARKVVVRERTFSIRGTLSTYDFPNRRMSVSITSSTYRPDAYKNTTRSVAFPRQLVIYDVQGRRAEADDMRARDQNVRIDGKVQNRDDLEATTLWEL